LKLSKRNGADGKKTEENRKKKRAENGEKRLPTA
jgi:hypothetical protein